MAKWMEVASRAALDELLKPAKPKQPPRAKLLAEAIDITTGDRQRDYGEPVANMRRIAAIYSGMTGKPFTATDVCDVLIALKLARAQENPTHRDSHVDAAAYVGIRYECACADRAAKADLI
jgi:hypothetical protein